MEVYESTSARRGAQLEVSTNEAIDSMSRMRMGLEDEDEDEAEDDDDDAAKNATLICPMTDPLSPKNDLSRPNVVPEGCVVIWGGVMWVTAWGGNVRACMHVCVCECACMCACMRVLIFGIAHPGTHADLGRTGSS